MKPTWLLLIAFAVGCKKSDTPAPLAISGLGPSLGPEYTTVTITGTGFSATPANDRVLFNGKTAGVVSTLAGTGVTGYADGNKATAAFNEITGIAVDKNGTIYVADFGNERVRKVVLE